MANGLKLDFTYGGRQRLEERTLVNAGGGLLQSHQYGYDAGGNIHTLDGQTYQYDSFNRLTQVNDGLKNTTYEYDEYGKRIKAIKNGAPTEYVYEKGLLKQAGNISYGYNSDGSRALKNNATDQWHYRYDQLGRLVQVKKNETEVIGSYGYDPAGWRIWKEENGKTYIYVRDGNQTIYQEVFNGPVDAYSTPEMKRAFVYLGNELVGTVVNGNEARYYINDHLGTTELVTDANGNILSQIQHTPFGDEVVVQSGTSSSSNSEDYYFTGKELDATGLYYFGARYYDPEVGLFISEDPSQDGLNWYEYCRANPLKYVDPDGRAVIIPVVIYMYITALAASPDLQMDIQLLCYDLSAGDYTSAAADIIGLALPGLPASVTNAPKRWLSGWLAKHGDELINLLKYEGHHLWPKYLKGPSQQFLSKMIRFKHIKLHMALDQIFRRTLGAEAFENIPIDELYKALLKFYKENYPELVDEFIKNAQNIMRNL